MDGYSGLVTTRRSLLIGSGAAALTGSAGSVAYAADATHDLSVDLPLAASEMRSAQGLRTGAITGHIFSMVGLTWRGAAARGVWIRTRAEDAWTGWQPLRMLHDLPDLGAEGDPHLRATAPLWVGRSEAIEVRVPGRSRTDLTLSLIETSATGGPTSPRRVAHDTPRPEIKSRRDWGANESWRSGGPTYNRTIQQVHVHHTATGNDYHRDEVRDILRAIYRYHTKNLGWSDIGYNFLVDRFGRIWQGRAGGSGRAVRGAHTLGFNSTSCGVSVIGNYDSATPDPEVIRSLVHLTAWKLDAYGREPGRRVSVYSHGSDRFPSGQAVRLPVIDGHRDTNETACPGGRLYAALPEIRRRTKKRLERFGGMEWQSAQ